ncbi:MAG: four helix bundle protein [bacterium]
MTDLPKFEMYEVGSQIRRSVKSIKSNIDHLETLFETKSLKSEKVYIDL